MDSCKEDVKPAGNRNGAVKIVGAIAGAAGAAVALFGNGAVKIVGAIAGAAGAAVALFGIWSWLSGRDSASASGADKRMKAPGKDGYIKRNDFERDPASYFRDLRK